MLLTRKDFEKLEKKTLAPYATLSSASRGREYPEKEDPFRTCFQKDRDRIIHSKAFRRLAGKTQVFVSTFGDHYRDRLSHTLEVAQISRDLARNLGLNEDLAEAIALAHDLGHSPFGHAGEEALNEIMKKFGMHFEHNEQSRRVIEKLEECYPDFPGLNLTFEVREGLIKHSTDFDKPWVLRNSNSRKQNLSKTLEAQIVDLADEIAYYAHDFDDGLRSKLFTKKDLKKLRLWVLAGKKGGRIVSNLISLMINDVFMQTKRNISKKKFTASFSAKFRKYIAQVRGFLWNHMYKSAKVRKHSLRGKKILKKSFFRFYKNPSLLPKKLQRKIKGGEIPAIVVKDYIAGMTDNFAEKIYEMSKM